MTGSAALKNSTRTKVLLCQGLAQSYIYKCIGNIHTRLFGSVQTLKDWGKLNKHQTDNWVGIPSEVNEPMSYEGAFYWQF